MDATDKLLLDDIFKVSPEWVIVAILEACGIVVISKATGDAMRSMRRRLDGGSACLE